MAEILYNKHTHTQPFNGLWSGTTRVGQYQKKHSPTHTHPDHRTSFITFLHSSTPSLRIAQLITSLRTLSEAFSKFSAGNSMHEIFQLLHQLFVTTGCLQMQPNQFSRDFQEISRIHFLKIPEDFLCDKPYNIIKKQVKFVMSINEHVTMSSDQCSPLCHPTSLLIYEQQTQQTHTSQSRLC